MKTNLVDYLENHMVCRLEHPEEKDVLEEKLKPVANSSDNRSSKNATVAKNILSQMEDEELEDLLRELLA